MSGPYIMPASGSNYNVFERLGHPGRYTSVTTVSNTTVNFTGSNYGHGAEIVGERSETGTITLSDFEITSLSEVKIPSQPSLFKAYFTL